MVAFGKRLSRRSYRASSAGEVVPDTPLDTARNERRQILLAATVLSIGAAILLPFSQIFDSRDLTLPRDLQPGLRAEAPLYAPPEGCQIRDWKVGEYLPADCYPEEMIPLRKLWAYGLERPRNIYRHVRRGGNYPIYLERHWVRVGADALLVSAPSYNSGKILMIVRGRFPGVDTFALAAATDADTRDYSQPPPDYVSGVRWGLWRESWLPLGFLAGVWLWGLLAPVAKAADNDLADEEPA